jgi:hypothetical protein
MRELTGALLAQARLSARVKARTRFARAPVLPVAFASTAAPAASDQAFAQR